MEQIEIIQNDSWIELLISGDACVEQEFWAAYGGRLNAVARRRLSQRLKQRVDAEDIVQSACRTFFRRVRQGEFQLADKNSLWQLLVTITLNKAREQARYHGRSCRNMNREQVLDHEPTSVTSGQSQPYIKVDFDDDLESAMKRLSDEQKEVFLRTLDDQTQDEIAEAMQCSKRTVRRMQGRIRERLQSMLPS